MPRCDRRLSLVVLTWLSAIALCAGLAACSKSGGAKSEGSKTEAAKVEAAKVDTAKVESKAAAVDACSPAAYDALLKKHVKAGKVDYAALKNTKADLDSFEAYLVQIGGCDVSKLSGAAHDAFWVNAYNAFNIKGVLDAWPIDNIKSVPGFLDKKLYRVAKMDLTINDMEYKQLIPKHQEARHHFAVVCADLGSVPLESHAYTAEELEAKLEKKTREFVADPNNFSVDIPGKKVRVSMLFSPEWYEKDFLVDKKFRGKKAVEYLIPYVDKPTAEFLASGDYTVSYIDWNWALNGVAASK
jgi:hypothetical protein